MCGDRCVKRESGDEWNCSGVRLNGFEADDVTRQRGSISKEDFGFFVVGTNREESFKIVCEESRNSFCMSDYV